MSEPYDFNVSIQTLNKELPETSQISIGDDACLFSIKYLISSMVSIAAGRWIADINRLRDEKVVKLNSGTHNDNMPCHFLH